MHQLDFSFTDFTELGGTITVSAFDLEANPLQEQGNVVGTFPFTGQLTTPVR